MLYFHMQNEALLNQNNLVIWNRFKFPFTKSLKSVEHCQTKLQLHTSKFPDCDGINETFDQTSARRKQVKSRDVENILQTKQSCLAAPGGSIYIGADE